MSDLEEKKSLLHRSSNSNSNSSIDTIYTIDEKINMIIDLYKSEGNTNYFGEKVTKTEHMIQCALSAQNDNEEDYIVLACLLHDIGHFLAKDDMGGLGVRNHGILGYYYLKDLDMDERICYLVEKHVDAKRYLVTIDDKNYDKLSDASKKTLEYQGGKMSDYELTAMEKDDDFLNILKVRKHDDKGKNEDQEIPDIETFIPLIRKYL